MKKITFELRKPLTKTLLVGMLVSSMTLGLITKEIHAEVNNSSQAVVNTTLTKEQEAALESINSEEFKKQVWPKVYALLDQYRVSNGKEKFSTLNRLYYKANAWAKEMAEKSNCSYIIDGETSDTKFAQYGQSAEEYIGFLSWRDLDALDKATPDDLANRIFTGLLATSKQALLSDSYNSIGLGYHTIVSNGNLIVFTTEEYDNNNEKVDILHISKIASKYNMESSTVEYDVESDLNNDSIIDVYDIIALANKVK